MGDLTLSEEQRGAGLERKIDDLRAFEREYRARITAYLRGLLRDLGDDLDASPRRERAGELLGLVGPATAFPFTFAGRSVAAPPGWGDSTSCWVVTEEWMRRACDFLREVAGE